MFRLFRYPTKLFITISSALLVAFGLTSCMEENEDTTCVTANVKFDYSHNMLSANAFENQVDEVNLYVFNANGVLNSQYSSRGTQLTNNYSVSISESDLEFGSYKFVAWAKSTSIAGDAADFTIPALTKGVSTLDDLSYLLKRESGLQNSELNNFLVGATDVVLNANNTYDVTVQLKKVNNRVRIILVSNDEDLDVADYKFSIEDQVGSGHIKYDYSLLSDIATTYLPYYTGNIQSSTDATGINRQTAVAEINTSRIMEVNKPRLVINNAETDDPIVNVDLAWLLSLTKMENHKEWSLQEYLDRQDEYAITLFLSGGSWIETTIIINGWVVNNINIEK